MPVVGTLVLAAPFFLARSSMPAWQALVIGFVLFTILMLTITMLKTKYWDRETPWQAR